MKIVFDANQEEIGLFDGEYVYDTKMNHLYRLDGEIGAGVNPFLAYTKTKEVTTFTLPLLGEIDSAEDFIWHVNILDSAEEDDTIVVKLSSPGGSLIAVDYLLQSMAQCKAHIHIDVTGICASAATLILDYADSFAISDNTEILIHNQVFGIGGKHADIIDAVVYADKQNKALLERYYGGMFSNEEMTALYGGKQFYMTNEEYLERFTKRQDLLKDTLDKEDKLEHATLPELEAELERLNLEIDSLNDPNGF